MEKQANLPLLIKLGVAAIVLAGGAWFFLRERAPDEAPDVQKVVQLAQKKDAAGLAQAMRNSNPQAASRAIEEFARLRPAEVPDRVGPLLVDADDASVRVAAVTAYIDAGDPAQAAPLSQALQQDEAPEVRGQAAKALGQLFCFDGMPALIRGLDDPEQYVRQCSIEAIQRMMGVSYQTYHADAPREERLQVVARIRQEYPKFEAQVRKDAARLRAGRQP